MSIVSDMLMKGGVENLLLLQAFGWQLYSWDEIY
jgi:hypothetical protein